jgi:undecaprenyl-diphosphatase
MADLSYLEAIVVGVLQGVSELFPVSSLGHSVLVPALIGGSWARDLDMTAPASPYLSVLVAMHVATALALVVFFRRDWVRLVRALLTSIRDRRIAAPDQRLVWLLLVGTVPVGIAGLALDKLLRTHLGKPIPSAIFLAVNGLVLYAVEKYRQRPGREDNESPRSSPNNTHSDQPAHLQETVVMSTISVEQTVPIAVVAPEEDSDRRLSRLSWTEACLIGAVQSFALLPGISRSGITMVGALARGLRHDDAARFAFLLSTPVILGAGLVKVPELFSPAAHAVLGPALVGSALAGISAYIAVRFLTSYFETRTLRPFALYCLIAGVGSLIWLTV